MVILCYNENMNEVIIALIGFAGAVVGSLFGYLGKSKKQAINDARREQSYHDMINKIFDEMKEIKQRLDEHNNYAEKIGGIEKSIISISKDIEYIRKDKDDKAKD